MVSEYTPTTGEVRNNLILMMEKPREVKPEEFDRWLMSVERAAAAKALRDAGEAFDRDYRGDCGGAVFPTEEGNWLRARAERMEKLDGVD